MNIFPKMESCYKAYKWWCRTSVALVLEIMWKMRQISDYLMNESAKTDPADIPESSKELEARTEVIRPRRVISSMSDVRNTSPYNLTPVRTNQQETKRKRLRKIRRSHSQIPSDCESSDVSSGNYSDRFRPMTARMEEALVLSYVMSRDSMRYL